MVWGAWLLIGCRVEDLRIHLPSKGLAAISQEDLERDVWQLRKESSGSDWYVQRMEQMGLTMFSSTTGFCVGKKEWNRISVVKNEHSSFHLSRAVQISLAKIQHSSSKRHSFCIYDEPVQKEDWILGDMSGMILQIDGKQIDTRLPNPDIHYPKLITHLREIVDLVSLL